MRCVFFGGMACQLQWRVSGALLNEWPAAAVVPEQQRLAHQHTTRPNEALHGAEYEAARTRVWPPAHGVRVCVCATVRGISAAIPCPATPPPPRRTVLRSQMETFSAPPNNFRAVSGPTFQDLQAPGPLGMAHPHYLRGNASLPCRCERVCGLVCVCVFNLARFHSPWAPHTHTTCGEMLRCRPGVCV